jgi:hypothetical protein
VWAGFFANKIYETDFTSVPPSAVSNGDLSAVVPSTLFAQRDGEFSDESAGRQRRRMLGVMGL